MKAFFKSNLGAYLLALAIFVIAWVLSPRDSLANIVGGAGFVIWSGYYVIRWFILKGEK